MTFDESALIESSSKMTITERVAWALWASECWYTTWSNREIYKKVGFTKSTLLYCKTRGIVVFDRVLNGRIQ